MSKTEKTKHRTIQEFVDEFLDALIYKIKGGDDPRRKFDYLMNPPNIKTSAILTESQLDSVAECCWLGESFPSLLPLKQLAVELANWSPSKTGKGREQLTATMISEHKEIIPMSVSQLIDKKDKKKKEKEVED